MAHFRCIERTARGAEDDDSIGLAACTPLAQPGCTRPITDRHRAVLAAALADRQPVPAAMVGVVEELVEWGGVVPSGELTAPGIGMLGTSPGGWLGCRRRQYGPNREAVLVRRPV